MTSSPLFWLLALALVVFALALLVVPLLRRNAVAPPEDESAAAAVFRDHRRQIDADFAAGTITAQERDAARDDLVARFGQELADSTAAPAVAAPSDRMRWTVAVVLAAVVPIAAGGFYLLLGNPSAITAGPAKDVPLASDPQVVAMVEGLAARLQANPEDGTGWAMLGRSYRALGRFEASALAYGEAAKRLPPSAQLLTDWAETVAQLQGRVLAGQPVELLDRALQIDPAYPKALALRGAAAMEGNDRVAALALWTRLKAALPAGSPEIAQVDAVIEQLKGPAAPPSPGPAAAAKAPSGPTGTPSAAPAAAAKAPAPDAKSQSASPATANATGTVEGRVELAPALAAKVAPGDTVFIFARDPDGSRMPLAAMKVPAAELPRNFALSDAMAMSPAATISKAKRVVVEARVSKSGQAAPQPGDLSGVSTVVAPGARGVRVLIDQVVR